MRHGGLGPGADGVRGGSNRGQWQISSVVGLESASANVNVNVNGEKKTKVVGEVYFSVGGE